MNRFVLSVGYRHEVIIDYFGNSHSGAEIAYVIEKTPLGTGGGLLLAAKAVNKDEPFLLLNGDTYFAVDLKELIEFSLTNNADWCVSLFRTGEEGRYMGMDVSPQGQITSLKSGTVRPGRLANGGVYWVQPCALLVSKFIYSGKIFLEDDIFPVVMASGQRLFGIEFSGPFIAIGMPDDYYRAPALFAL